MFADSSTTSTDVKIGVGRDGCSVVHTEKVTFTG